MEFQEIKEFIVKKATRLNACIDELDRAKESKTLDQLIVVVRDNANWCRDVKFLSDEQSIEYFNFSLSNLFNSGYRNSGNRNSGNSNSGNRNSGNRNSGDSNSGYSNSGNWNSGDSNSGDSNSGDRTSGYRNSGNSNSGNRNSGNRNSGDSNSGYRNSGDRNSGNRNSGNRNSGNRNSGYSNSGDRNSGDRNSGYSNSGDSNSGYSNSGYRNSGYSNSGNSNSGNWNSGNRNSGDSNSGYRNSGAFCTNKDPVLWLFDKPTKMTVRHWEQTEVRNLMYNIDCNIWVPDSMMSDEEKENYPSYETTGGYLKSIPLKEAWSNFWNNLSDDKKQLFLDLPNFDADKFEEITGIRV